MARAFTQTVLRLTPPYNPITLVLETSEEAEALRNLLGESTGTKPLYEIYTAYMREYKKQKEVIENAVSRQ